MSRARADRRRQQRQPGAGGPTRARAARPTWWLAVAAVAIGAVVHLGALHGTFVYDDRMTVLGNPSIRDIASPRALLLYDVFRPVVNFSYAVDHAIWGLDPFGYHLTNLLLHLVNVGLLFAVVLGLARRCQLGRDDGADDLGPRVTATVAAVLLATHPLMTQAVAYVSGRSELLATLFLLTAVSAFQRASRDGRVAWAVVGGVAFLLGVASKETVAMLPLVLLAAEVLLPEKSPESRRRRLLQVHLPFVGLLLLAGLARLAVFLRLEGGDQMLGLRQHLLTESVVLWRYVGLLLAPVNQSILHPVETAAGLASPGVIPALLGLGVAGVGLALLGRRLPLVVLGLVSFLLLLAPSHLVPLQEAMAEHRLYTAACGFFLAVGALAGELARRLEGRGRRALGAALVAGVTAIALLAAATVARTRVWADEVVLWADAAVKAPRTWAAQYAHADALRMAGRCDEAIPVYRRAVELEPGQTAARLNLGICLAEIGLADDARRAFEEVRRLDPSDPQPAVNLGALAARIGDFAAARGHLLDAIRLDPGAVAPRMMLAQLAEAAFGDARTALALCEEVARLEPTTPGVEECLRRNRKALTMLSSR